MIATVALALKLGLTLGEKGGGHHDEHDELPSNASFLQSSKGNEIQEDEVD
jgi:hypothetical protein